MEHHDILKELMQICDAIDAISVEAFEYGCEDSLSRDVYNIFGMIDVLKDDVKKEVSNDDIRDILGY